MECLPFALRWEEGPIDCLNDCNRARSQRLTLFGDRQAFGTGVLWVCCPLDESFQFQGTKDRGGHFDVDLCLLCEAQLIRLPLVGVEPPGTCQKYELHVGQVERIQCGCDGALPT